MQRSRLVDPAPPTPAAPDAGPRERASRLHVAGLAVSLALHLLGWGVIRIIHEPRADEPAPVSIIDLDLAPIAPAAETLPPEEELPARVDPPADLQAGVPEAPPPAELDGIGVLDAGVDAAIDAGLDAARALDAGRARDAGLDAHERLDAQDELDAGVDAGVDAPAAEVASGGDAGVSDGGAAVAELALDGGVSDAGTGGDAGAVATRDEPDRLGRPPRATTGTAANLLAYAPDGHVVTLLARLDRLRGTEWAGRVDAMLAPLPDHDALIGDEPVQLTDVFDTLVISSPDPSSADATTLVARSRIAPAELRELLDHPDAHVTWTPVVGGALGRRQPSRRVIPGDVRVFLGWAPGWTTLARPDDLPGLLQPSASALDQSFAEEARLPDWLARVQTIEIESGAADGPALMVTAAGMFPPALDLPLVDVDVPGPERATLTLTVDPAGFVVRGSLRYPDAGAAATAADALVRARKQLLASTLARIALGSARGLNAVRGLTVQRTGSRVAFATSISSGDARVLLARVADLVEARFEDVRRRPARPAPGPRVDGGVPRPRADGGVP